MIHDYEQKNVLKRQKISRWGDATTHAEETIDI